MNRHEFYEIVSTQGQRRFKTERFDEFEKRVMDVHDKRIKTKFTPEWRKDSEK